MDAATAHLARQRDDTVAAYIAVSYAIGYLGGWRDHFVDRHVLGALRGAVALLDEFDRELTSRLPSWGYWPSSAQALDRMVDVVDRERVRFADQRDLRELAGAA